MPHRSKKYKTKPQSFKITLEPEQLQLLEEVLAYYRERGLKRYKTNILLEAFDLGMTQLLKRFR